MNKFFKIAIFLVVIAGLGYGFVLLFVSPDIDNSKTTLTASYFDNITDTNVCSEHFNTETVSFCETFTAGLSTSTFTHSESLVGENIAVTITIGDNEDIFIVSFIEEANPGISGFFHKTNYKIDTIQ